MSDAPTTEPAAAEAASTAPAEEPKKGRPSIKELVQRYGFLAVGIYLTTAVIAFSIGFALFSLVFDPNQWDVDLGEATGYGASAVAAWLVFVKGSQIPRIMLTAALTPAIAAKLGREPAEAEAPAADAVPQPAEATS